MDVEMKATQHVLFPTFLNEAEYPLFVEEKDGLLARIRNIRDEDVAGRQFSGQRYPNGYTSFYSRDQLFSDPAFSNLVKFIYTVAHDYGQRQYWDLQNYSLVMTQLWCNINPKNSFHRDHIHPYSQISGVIYLQCDDSNPAISLKDPRAGRWMLPSPVAQNRPENMLYASVPPVEGKLLMFPAWLEHGVPQNQAETERISMSYNFELRQN